MIIDTKKCGKSGVIDSTQHAHVASLFVVTGHFTTGVIARFMGHAWTEEALIGTVSSAKTGDTMFHELICYPANTRDFWRVPEYLTKCLDTLDIPEGETLALHVPIPVLGSSEEEVQHFYDILGAVARSKIAVIVYYSK